MVWRPLEERAEDKRLGEERLNFFLSPFLGGHVLQKHDLAIVILKSSSGKKDNDAGRHVSRKSIEGHLLFLEGVGWVEEWRSFGGRELPEKMGNETRGQNVTRHSQFIGKRSSRPYALRYGSAKTTHTTNLIFPKRLSMFACSIPWGSST